MGQYSDQFMIFTCDNCGAQAHLDGVVGGPLGAPANWKQVQPQTTSDGDWFCTYGCLSQWAADMQARMDARRAAQTVKASETNGSTDSSEESEESEQEPAAASSES